MKMKYSLRMETNKIWLAWF